MRIFELINLAFATLRANLLRSILTMLGIIIGISSVIIIISIGQGATKSITDQISSFGTNLIIISPGSQSFSNCPSAPTRMDTLTLEDAEALAQKNAIANLEAVSPIIAQSGLISADGQSKIANIIGTKENYFSINALEPMYGSILTNDDNDTLAKLVFLGPELAKNLFGEKIDPVGKKVTIGTKNFRVIGVSQPKGSIGLSNPDNNAYIPLNTGMKLVFGQNYLSVIFAKASDARLLNNTIDDIKAFLLTRHKIDDPRQADFSVNSSKDALATLGTVTNLLTLMLAGIAGISLLVGGIGIMNIMLVSVTERTKEIGLLKAIGAKRKDILAQILVESLVLTFFGAFVGITLGIASSWGISKLLGISFIVTPLSIALSVGVASLVGIGFGIYPARRAAQLNPIDALRYE